VDVYSFWSEQRRASWKKNPGSDEFNFEISDGMFGGKHLTLSHYFSENGALAESLDWVFVVYRDPTDRLVSRHYYSLRNSSKNGVWDEMPLWVELGHALNRVRRMKATTSFLIHKKDGAGFRYFIVNYRYLRQGVAAFLGNFPEIDADQVLENLGTINQNPLAIRVRPSARGQIIRIAVRLAVSASHHRLDYRLAPAGVFRVVKGIPTKKERGGWRRHTI
jgi:hypothetical protein